MKHASFFGHLYISPGDDRQLPRSAPKDRG